MSKLFTATAELYWTHERLTLPEVNQQTHLFTTTAQLTNLLMTHLHTLTFTTQFAANAPKLRSIYLFI